MPPCADPPGPESWCPRRLWTISRCARCSLPSWQRAALSPLLRYSPLSPAPGGGSKAAAFAIGFVTGQAAFFLLALSLGIATFGNSENHPTLIAVLVIAFGAALLLTAVWVRRPRNEAQFEPGDPILGPSRFVLASRACDRFRPWRWERCWESGAQRGSASRSL